MAKILTPASWSGVPLHVLIFLTAAVAIGRVGGATGMNAWIAQTVLPGTVPSDPYILAAFIATISIIIHMLLGSVIAVMGIVIPAMLAFTGSMGISTIIPVMIAYIAINAHFILPFHNLAILVGVGEDTVCIRKRNDQIRCTVYDRAVHYYCRRCCTLVESNRSVVICLKK